jgi:hypothetical protein
MTRKPTKLSDVMAKKAAAATPPPEPESDALRTLTLG